MFKLFKICRAKFAGVVIVFVSEFKFNFDFAGFSARLAEVLLVVVVLVVAVIGSGGGVGDILYLVVGFVDEIFGIVGC